MISGRTGGHLADNGRLGSDQCHRNVALKTTQDLKEESNEDLTPSSYANPTVTVGLSFQHSPDSSRFWRFARSSPVTYPNTFVHKCAETICHSRAQPSNHCQARHGKSIHFAWTPWSGSGKCQFRIRFVDIASSTSAFFWLSLSISSDRLPDFGPHSGIARALNSRRSPTKPVRRSDPYPLHGQALS